MPRPQPSHVKKLHSRLLRWYRIHHRRLPWRNGTDPYRIVVSEVMLQQTQVSRVREKYPLFLRAFPTLGSLAAAPLSEVIVAWQGLGYNNRAVRLRNLARRVRERHGGVIPPEASALEKLPGLGRYSAGAVACFAFGGRVPVVDVNIRRVLSRIFFPLRAAGDVKDLRMIWRLAGEVLPGDARSWNQALMDLGSLICTAARPDCAGCPVSDLCSSYPEMRRSGRLRRPPPLERAKKIEPAYREIPRRLWRGRIVEILRNVNGRGPIGLRQLGDELGSDADGADLRFFRGLLRQLERDELVEISGRPSDPRVQLCRT